MEVSSIINLVHEKLWGVPLLLLFICAGVLFSINSRFLQLRHVRNMVGQLWLKKEGTSGISGFQAFSIALGGRVGPGNIYGVAMSIYMGGPGALFWMWVFTFVASASAFMEGTLAQVFKEKVDGEYRGGPAYYIEHGLGQKWLGVAYAIVMVITCGLFNAGNQARYFSVALNEGFGIPRWAVAVIAIAVAGFILQGGIRRVARMAEKLVPVLVLGYLLMAFVIILMDIKQVPEVLGQVISSAFGRNAVFGGITGMAISYGIKRGVFTNEAGQGTGPHAAGSSEVSHPVRQGLLDALSVWVDSLGVCTATGLMLLLTGQYNVTAKNGELLVANIPGIEAGEKFVQCAVDTALPGFGQSFISIAIGLFAFSSMMAYLCYSESNVAYLFRGKNVRLALTISRFLALGMILFGSLYITKMTSILVGLGLGMSAWLNIAALMFLAPVGLKVLKDFETHFKFHESLNFDAKRLGIKGTSCWGEVAKQAEPAFQKEIHVESTDSADLGKA